MKRNFIIPAAVVLAGCFSLGAGAQNSTRRGSNAPSGNPAAQHSTQQSNRPATRGNAAASQVSDQTFAKHAAEGGIAEVKLGELAQNKGSNQAVKDYGKLMVSDHSKANDQLKQIAAKNNLELPADMNARDQAAYDRLSKLSGAEFDRAYAQKMVRDHNKDIAEFQNEASNGQNQDLKSFANDTLPTLREHLQKARDMRRQISQSTRATTTNRNQS